MILLDITRKIRNFLITEILSIKYNLQKNRSKIDFFDEKILKNKKVIIIGPAETSLSYLKGNEIDKFDFIVRVNKSPLTLQGKEKQLGSRTDILYHCFSEDPIDGGGKFDFELLYKQRNKYIIYSYAAPELERVFLNTVLKYKEKNFYRVKLEFFNEIKKDYPAKWPTTGLQAVLHLMSTDFKELHITGFTFFRTSYISDYTNLEINNSEESRKKQIEKSGSHSYDGELNLFIKHYNLNKFKNIYLDRNIIEIISNSN